LLWINLAELICHLEYLGHTVKHALRFPSSNSDELLFRCDAYESYFDKLFGR
jgi:formate-dependent nitrite reductase cytochrome c552 subunit